MQTILNNIIHGNKFLKKSLFSNKISVILRSYFKPLVTMN